MGWMSLSTNEIKIFSSNIFPSFGIVISVHVEN